MGFHGLIPSFQSVSFIVVADHPTPHHGSSHFSITIHQQCCLFTTRPRGTRFMCVTYLLAMNGKKSEISSVKKVI